MTATVVLEYVPGYVPEYVPGTWVAVVTDGCIALLPAGTDPATVRRLWSSMSTDAAALVRHLQELTRDGLASLPPFALVAVAGRRVHVVLRGGVEVDVRTAGRSLLLTAPDVTTWSEQVASDVDAVTVRPAGAPGPVEEDGLPLVSGVAHVGAVRVVLHEAAAPDAEPGVDAGSPAQVPVDARDLRAALAPAGYLEPGPAGRGLPDVDPFDHTLLRPAPLEETRPAPDADAALRDLLAEERRLAADAPATEASAVDALVADVLVADVLTDDVLVADAPAADDLRPASGRAGHRAGHPAASPTGRPELPGVGASGRTAPARVALSTGERITLTRPVLIGRAPQASRVISTQVPRLVTVPSPLQDISRTHAEVRMDGDDVLLTDLRSTNGVVVVRCDTGPQRLQPGVATVLVPGSLVDLGEGVSFTVERGA